MNQPFSPRLALAIFLPTAIGTVTLVVLTWLGMASVLREGSTSNLANILPTIVRSLEPDLGRPSVELQQVVRDLAQEPSVRLTVITEEGQVIAESSRPYEQMLDMDNHRLRPEIARARQQGYGSAIRFSDTVGETFVYTATSVQLPGGEKVVVRLSEPIKVLNALNRRMLILLAGSILAGVLATGIVGGWFHYRVLQPIAAIIHSARDRSPTSMDPIPVPAAPEAAALARSINLLSERAERQVAQLQEEHAFLETILASVAEGVLVLDKRATVVRSNPAASNLLGWDGELVGASLDEVLPAQVAREITSSLLAPGDVHRLEAEILRSGRTLSLLCSPIGDSGAVLTARDLTQSLHLSQVRTDLVANVSHELKTPLTAIRGYAETLRDGALADPNTTRRFISRIVQQCNRLEAILQDLLKLSWLEHESSVEALDTVDLVEIAEESLEMLGATAKSRGIELVGELSEAKIRQANRKALSELASNLIENAIKYNREGGQVVVRVETDTTAGTVVLTVTDTGRGIPEASQQRIFERFYRVDRGRGRAEGGTGLGLAIVKHAVERHRGQITVDSKVMQGTTFTVRIPQDGLG